MATRLGERSRPASRPSRAGFEPVGLSTCHVFPPAFAIKILFSLGARLCEPQRKPNSTTLVKFKHTMRLHVAAGQRPALPSKRDRQGVDETLQVCDVVPPAFGLEITATRLVKEAPPALSHETKVALPLSYG